MTFLYILGDGVDWHAVVFFAVALDVDGDGGVVVGGLRWWGVCFGQGFDEDGGLVVWEEGGLGDENLFLSPLHLPLPLILTHQHHLLPLTSPLRPRITTTHHTRQRLLQPHLLRNVLFYYFLWGIVGWRYIGGVLVGCLVVEGGGDRVLEAVVIGGCYEGGDIFVLGELVVFDYHYSTVVHAD